MKFPKLFYKFSDSFPILNHFHAIWIDDNIVERGAFLKKNHDTLCFFHVAWIMEAVKCKVYERSGEGFKSRRGWPKVYYSPRVFPAVFNILLYGLETYCSENDPEIEPFLSISFHACPFGWIYFFACTRAVLFSLCLVVDVTARLKINSPICMRTWLKPSPRKQNPFISTRVIWTKPLFFCSI